MSLFPAFLNMGGLQILLILFVALLLFGGKRLPEVARGLGKSLREFKKATSGVEDQLKRIMEEEAPARKAKRRKKLAASQPGAKTGDEAAGGVEKTVSVASAVLATDVPTTPEDTSIYDEAASSGTSGGNGADDDDSVDSYHPYDEGGGSGRDSLSTSTPTSEPTPKSTATQPGGDVSDGGGI